MKIEHDKEIIVGKTSIRVFRKVQEIPFFVKDIEQLCFNPCAASEYKYSVLINTVLSDDNVRLFINKEQYEYLQEK